jgi:hypothetical protein
MHGILNAAEAFAKTIIGCHSLSREIIAKTNTTQHPNIAPIWFRIRASGVIYTQELKKIRFQK